MKRWICAQVFEEMKPCFKTRYLTWSGVGNLCGSENLCETQKKDSRAKHSTSKQISYRYPLKNRCFPVKKQKLFCYTLNCPNHERDKLIFHPGWLGFLVCFWVAWFFLVSSTTGDQHPATRSNQAQGSLQEVEGVIFWLRRWLVVFWWGGGGFTRLLGGGLLRYVVCFTPRIGEMIQFDKYFFKWVETTNKVNIVEIWVSGLWKHNHLFKRDWKWW